MQDVHKTGNWIRRFTIFLLIPMIILCQILGWLEINNSLSLAFKKSESLKIDASNLPFIGKLLFFALHSLSTLFLLYAIFYFLKFLSFYQKGIFFSKEVLSILKKINIVILVWAIYEFLFTTLASLLISMFKPVGQRYISVAFKDDDVLHFFIVLIIFMVLSLVQEAYKIKCEQDLVV